MFRSKKLTKSIKISHGFFNKKGGVSKGIYKSLNCGIGSNDKKTNVKKNLKIAKKKICNVSKQIFLVKQYHSSKFIYIANSSKINSKSKKADAIITDKKKFPIAILTADCVPLLIHDKKRGMIAAIHAGWKGAFKGIVQKVIKFMISKGCYPKNMTVAIGPSISIKNYEVKKVIRKNNNIRIMMDSDKEFLEYDHVVMACHADQTLKLIEPSTKENDLLKNFKYNENQAYLHYDENLMPRNRSAWASWNAISNTDASETCVTYWLNKLQNLQTQTNYFLTLNPISKINKDKIIKTIKFTHPSFNLETYKLQNELKNLQGKQNTWFCGSYFGYGFHEDGLNSSLELLKLLKN